MSTYFAATSIGNAEARETAVESVGQLIARPIEVLLTGLMALFRAFEPRR